MDSRRSVQRTESISFFPSYIRQAFCHDIVVGLARWFRTSFNHFWECHWRYPRIGFFLVEIRGPGPCRGASTGFMVASGGVLTEGYGHDGPGVCLGDGQTVARWTRRRAAPAYAPIPDLTWPDLSIHHGGLVCWQINKTYPSRLQQTVLFWVPPAFVWNLPVHWLHPNIPGDPVWYNQSCNTKCWFAQLLLESITWRRVSMYMCVCLDVKRMKLISAAISIHGV